LVFAILSISKFNPNARIIIAGDPKQIPPVLDVNDKDLEELDIKEENIYTMLNLESFKEQEQQLRECDTILNLPIQYRSVEKIGKLFSALSYQDLLEHSRKSETPKPLPDMFKKIISNSLTFINIPLNSDDSIFKIRQLFYSSYHVYSAILVSEILKYLDPLLGDSESWSIGLIAPYKAQAILMNKLVSASSLSPKIKIYADTVHGFQGDECDMVFFIVNPNNYHYTGDKRCLLSKEFIYNVAISRAKDYLIVIHPFDDISNNPFINKIKKTYEDSFGLTNFCSNTEIEDKLFDNFNYIGTNSYITGHDTVNVFSQSGKKYFIKANNSAVDIQL
jgi:superfamily I DNA and/or RNA helicase